MILGADGKPYKQIQKPDRVEYAPIRLEDKYSTYPSNNLSPAKVARIFRESDQGDIYRLMELFEELEGKDTHVFSQFQTRKSAVMGLDWEIMDAGQEKLDHEVAEFVRNVVDECLDMEDVFMDLLDAIGKGFSVMEILWDIRNGRAYPKLKWREPKKFCFGDYQEMRLLNDENPINGMELPPNKFVINKNKSRSGRPNRAGVMWVVTWMTLFKTYTVKDWLAFSEVYGMPIRIGKYDTSATQEDKEALMRAIISIGSDAAGVINKNTEVQFVEAVKSDGELFTNLANFCNAEISKAVLGQTLTTEVGTAGGSRALGETQNQVRKDLVRSDAKTLAKTLRRDLFAPLVLFNFGPQVKVPWLKFATEEQEDADKKADRYKTIICDIGLPVSNAHMYEAFGIPTPQEGEALVKPPAAGTLPLPFKDDLQLLALKNSEKKSQAVIDKFVSELRAAGVAATADDMAGIRKVIEESVDLKELREKLLSVYKGLNKKKLQELLERALFTAQLFGSQEIAAMNGDKVNVIDELKPLEFEQAVKYFGDKVPMRPAEFKQLLDAVKSKAFTVASVTQIEYMQDIFDAIKKSLSNGQTVAEFKKGLTELLESKGWEGQLPYHIDLVFRQNVQTAYQVGRYQQMTTAAAVEARPYWMYDAVNDERTRPTHKMMDGQVRRYDDPFWDEWYPPNGFGCRCGVITLSAQQVKQRGIDVQRGMPHATVDIETGEITHWKPDKGFDVNPAKTEYKPDLSNIDSDLKEAYLQK